MKICVTSQGDNLDAKIDPRFGRCAYFILFDSDTLDYEVKRNPNAQDAGGISVTSAKLMENWGVGMVLTGNIGPKATQVLQSAEIKIITGVTGTVKGAIEKYQKQNAKGDSC